MNRTALDRTVIPFGKIVRQHGITRAGPSGGGINTYKLQLFNVGATLFENLKSIQISKTPLLEDTPAYLDPKSYRTLELIADSSPLGARWQETPAVLLRVSTQEGDLKGLEVALLRSQFPEANTGVYLCDFINAEVTDPDLKIRGKIKRFFDTGNSRLPMTNIEVERSTGELFEFPAALITADIKKDGNAWIVPDLELWANLKNISAERDDQ